MEFARDVLEEPLDPWEEWLVIHGGELLPDGRPRFRRLLILVARQNGKTHVLVVLTLFWLFKERQKLILGTSNKLEYAKETWKKVAERIRSNPALLDFMLPGKRNGIRGGNNDVSVETADGCTYKVAAANEDSGRSLTVNRLVMDEIRSLFDFEAYAAAYNAMNAIDDAQAWFITNQGDNRAVLLDMLHGAALAYIEDPSTAEDDGAIFLAEWSAPLECEIDDPEALAMANPNMNRRGLRTLVADARAAKLAGGEAETKFKTEVLCQRVPALDPAVDPEAWDKSVRVFELPRDRRVAVIDVSRDMRRATLEVGRMTPGGKVQLVAAESWVGADAMKRMRAELPGLAKSMSLRKLGFMPIGPAAAIVPAMQKNGRVRWPSGLEIEPITGADVFELCMGFAEQVASGDIEHLGEELLDYQVKSAGKKWSGKRWEFDWTGDGYVEAAFAAAGVVHLARMMPAPVGPVRLIGPDD